MATRRQKKAFRARRFAQHLVRFVDQHRFPQFQLTDELVALESRRQTYGETKMSDAELASLEPLRDAQRWKEVTIDGLVDEMAEWWSKGWGWFYPLQSMIDSTLGDWIMKKALLEIKRQAEDDFLDYLVRRGGCERFIESYQRS